MAKGTGTPKVISNITNGNLLRQVNVTDGVAGIVATVSTSALIGAVKTVYSLQDAESKGYTLEAEPFVHRHLSEFYQELGGTQELWILGTEDTMTMAQALTSTNQNGVLKLLTISQGRVNIVGVMRDPATAYTGGEAYLDSDVQAAILASKALAQYQQSINRPVRFLIEGRVVNPTVANTFKPNTSTNGYAGVVLSSTLNDGSASVALVLARAVKYEAHIKLGNGQNGALSIIQGYIGSRKIEEFTPTELDVLSDNGYIIFHIREGVSGYFIGRDNMASDDDFHILVHGRIIDKAQRIAASTSTPFLETSIRMTSEGTINETDAKYLEDIIKQQLLANMADQVSAIDILIPLNQDIVNNSTLEVIIKVLPLGYLTWIVVNLGLTNKI